MTKDGSQTYDANAGFWVKSSGTIATSTVKNSRTRRS